MAKPSKVTLQILRLSEDSIRVTPFRDGSALESTVKTSRICPFHSALVADRAREILGILARANGGAPGLLPVLERAGQAIWVDLLPPFLKERLADARDGDLLLHLDAALTGIPWELLHDGDDFLVRHYRLGRLVTLDDAAGVGLQRSMQPPLDVLIVADPSGDLPGARAEAEELAVQLEASEAIGSVRVMAGSVGVRAFRDALGGFDVLHFAGHAVTGRDGEACLRLHDGPFPAGLLAQLRGQIDFPGLVFLNACGSSDDTVRLSSGDDPMAGVSGVAASLLLCGVRHFVGTLWEVRDEIARRFSGAFYERLLDGASIGQAMATAREAISAAHGAESLLWADYLLYGDPTWTIERRQPRLDDFAVLDGLERKYRSELTADDPATRLTAAAMLLRLGDRSVVAAIEKDFGTLERWLRADAPDEARRRAALIVQAMATASGLHLDAPVDELPDVESVRRLRDRLVSG